MKVKYLGESFYDGFGLTHNKEYECTGVYEDKYLLLIDDEEEEFMYLIGNPKLDWEIIEDENNILKNTFDKHRT